MPASNQLLNDGRYRINQQIPLNGQTAVYEAYDTVNESNVIVKEILVPVNKVMPATQQEHVLNSFVDQAKQLTEIRHNALIQVRDYFSDIGKQYLVLESLDGDHLGEAIETAGVGFGLPDVLNWADQILDAVHYLHTCSPPIIHGNIRPQHIRLTTGNSIKLLAFGLSDNKGNGLNTSISGQSLETEINYSPLEQIWEDLDPASQKVISNSFDESDSRALTGSLTPGADIYSIGATLYHLLTGRKPVDALERSIELLEGKPDPLKPISELAPDVPYEICEVVRKAMEIKLSGRYDSAAILRQVLKTAYIRANERQEEEERELAEAAETLRAAELLKQDEVKELLAQKQKEIEEEQKRQAEILEQKLREAEEQRLAAERRAAEMERMLREKEAVAVKPSQNDEALLDLDLLDIPDLSGSASEEKPADLFSRFEKDRISDKESSIAAEAPINATSPSATVDENDQAADKFSESEETGADIQLIEVEGPNSDLNNESVSPSNADPVEAASAYPTANTIQEKAPDTYPYSSFDSDVEVTVSGGRLTMPMIAGGIGLVLCFVVLAGWYFIPSSSSTGEATVQVPTAAVVSEQPAATEPEQPADPVSTDITGSETEQSGPVESAVQSDAQDQQRKAATQPTPQRTPRVKEETPKPTPERRRVTVDDLINDH